MTWLYWLLAPVVLTGIGVLGIMVRSVRGPGAGRSADPVSDHQKLLEALAKAHPPITAPHNFTVGTTAGEAPTSGS